MTTFETIFNDPSLPQTKSQRPGDRQKIDASNRPETNAGSIPPLPCQAEKCSANDQPRSDQRGRRSIFR